MERRKKEDKRRGGRERRRERREARWRGAGGNGRKREGKIGENSYEFSVSLSHLITFINMQ